MVTTRTRNNLQLFPSFERFLLTSFVRTVFFFYMMYRNIILNNLSQNSFVMAVVMVFSAIFNSMCICYEFYFLRFMNPLLAHLTKGHVTITNYLNRITVFKATFPLSTIFQLYRRCQFYWQYPYNGEGHLRFFILA